MQEQERDIAILLGFCRWRESLFRLTKSCPEMDSDETRGQWTCRCCLEWPWRPDYQPWSRYMSAYGDFGQQARLLWSRCRSWCQKTPASFLLSSNDCDSVNICIDLYLQVQASLFGELHVCFRARTRDRMSKLQKLMSIGQNAMSPLLKSLLCVVWS